MEWADPNPTIPKSGSAVTAPDPSTLPAYAVMTLRDHFAAQALPPAIRQAAELGMRGQLDMPVPAKAAELAYGVADAMLAARGGLA